MTRHPCPGPGGLAAPRFPGACARCPAGASSSIRRPCSARCRTSGSAATEFGPVGFLEDDPGAKADAACGLRPDRRRRVPAGAAARPWPRPAARGRRLHRRLPRLRRRDGCARGVHRHRRVRRTAGARRRRLGDTAGQPRPDQRPRPSSAGSRPACTRTSARWSRPARRPSAWSPGRGSALCVDTGHLLVGGADPVALTTAYPDRVLHVHLKDVDDALAHQVVDGSLAFGDAVRKGHVPPARRGRRRHRPMVATLEGAGYQGWYVLEQDVMLDGPPDGEGPVGDVRAASRTCWAWAHRASRS